MTTDETLLQTPQSRQKEVPDRRNTSSPHNQSKWDAVRSRLGPSLFCNKVIGAERAMSTLDTSSKGAGHAHLSAPAVIIIGDFDCGRIEESERGMDAYIVLKEAHGQVIR